MRRGLASFTFDLSVTSKTEALRVPAVSKPP